MTKEEKNKAFGECLETIGEKFGRVNFRERLMLRMSFDAGADLKKRYEKQSGWHNLKKHPEDLPKESGAVFVFDKDDGGQDYKVAMFWKEDGAFTGSYLAKLNVTAWREIPIYQEEA